MNKRQRRTLSWLGVGIAVFATSAICTAQNNADPAAQALALFKEGVQLRKEGKCVEALPKLEQSVRLRTIAGAVLNVALCEENLGRLAAALEHYRALQLLLAPEDERTTLAQSRVEDLESRVPRLRVSLPPSVTDAQLSVDGQTTALRNRVTELRLDAGERTLVFSKGDKELRKETIVLETGETVDVVLEAPPDTTEPVPARAVPAQTTSAQVGPEPRESRDDPEEGLSPPPLISLIGGGVGLVGIGLGTGMGLLALDRRAQLDDLCPEPERCSQEGVNVAEEGALFGNISTVAFAVGGAATAAGLILWLLDDGSSSPVTTGVTSDRQGAWVGYEARF